jgi:KDO2-lipid IV(A) lauroyltransferase
MLLYVVKAFAFFIRILPVSVALFIGRMIGLFGYAFDHRHRSLAYANLKIAFAREKKTGEIKRILRKAFENYGQNIIELLRLPLIDPHKYIKVEGREHVEQALKKGKGVIFLAMHFGSWELCNFIPRLFNHPYKVVVNPQKRYSKLDDLLNSYRQQAGAGLLNPGAGMREFVRSLKNNEMVGMVVDQGGRTGNLINFFGRDSSMSTGAIKMGIKLDVAVCFCTLTREQGPYHRLVISPALEFKKDGDLDDDIHRSLEGIIRTMEGYIRKYPSEYMWFYKIWKYSKESTIVILNDKKMGHLHQALALDQSIKQALGERGIKAQTEVIDIEFKNKIREKAFSAISFVSHRRVSQGRLRYLKWFLKRKSFLEVMSVKGDFVISCGSSVSGVNYFLSQDYRAKSIVIQKPGILNFNRFDLVVLPEHDKSIFIPESKKVLYTKITPNLITPQYVHEQAKSLSLKFPELQDKTPATIGIFWGGDSKHFVISVYLAKQILDQLQEAVISLQGRLLLTTSRRTSIETEAVIKESLKGFHHCPFAIFPKEHNIPEAVGGILGLSDIVIVSSDSISMVSEAVSSGKTVVVFKAEPRVAGGVLKHDLFVDRLHKDGHLFCVKPEELGSFVLRIGKERLTTKPINHLELLLNAAREII